MNLIFGIMIKSMDGGVCSEMIPIECVECMNVVYLPYTFDKSNPDNIEFEGIIGYCKYHKEDCYKLKDICEFIKGFESFQLDFRLRIAKDSKVIINERIEKAKEFWKRMEVLV